MWTRAIGSGLRRAGQLGMAVSLGALALGTALALLDGPSTYALGEPPAQPGPGLLLRSSAFGASVVINEVAWGGTAASSADEWIELYNTTAEPVTLTGWSLTNTASLQASLVGVIPAHGYFLLERSDDNTVSDIPADQIYTGALLNPPTPDRLMLRDAGGVLVDTANADGGAWPAGTGSPGYASMERISALAADADSSWTGNDGILRNGLDAGGAPLNGTPKARNSATPTGVNVGLAKRGPERGVAGQELTYTLSFSNTGVDAAPEVRLTDTLPAGVSYVRDSSPYSLTQAGSVLVWQVGDLPAGGLVYSFTLVGQAAIGASGVLTNRASIGSSVTETITSDNTAWAATTVAQALADVSIVKRGPLSVTAGGRLTYTLAISNSGEREALAVVVTDVLPDEVSFTQQSAVYPFTRNGIALAWQVGALPAAGKVTTFTVSGLVSPSASGELVNRAGITTTSPQFWLADNQAVFSTWVAHPPGARDVVINELAWGGTAASSADEWIELYNTTAEPVTLTGWSLTNTASLQVSLVGAIPPYGYFLLERSDDNTVSDIPADQIYTGALLNPPTPDWLMLRDGGGALVDSANADGGGWPAGTGSPGYVSMERISALAADADSSWTGNDGILRNGLDAGGSPLNGTPKARNSATPTGVNVALAKRGPERVVAGRELTYTLSFSNTGAEAAPGVRLTDTLPAGVRYARDSSPYSLTQVGSALVWPVGALPAGGLVYSFTLVGQAAADASGVLTNQASIGSSVTETITGDNTAWAATTVVQPLADVSIAKSGPLSVTAGSRLTYTLAFSNPGEYEALGVVITDVLPDGVSFTQQSAVYSFTRSGHVLTWQVGALPAASGTLSLTISGLVSPSAAGLVVNRAGITTTSPEAHLADNQTVFTTTVLRPAGVRDVVINEVAWGGTAASPADEWIELRNNTPDTLDLDGWRLRAYTGTLDIALTGFIPANGYFLLERSDDQTVSDIAADWIGSFGGGLANAGDCLTLSDATGRAIDTANADGGAWPAGTGSPDYTSMERIHVLAADTDSEWAANAGALRNGLDANGNLLNATPKAANAAAAPALAILKSGPHGASAGQPVTYTLAFSNAGGQTAPGVRLTDTLPAEVSYLRDSSPYSLTQAGNVLVWQVGALLADGLARSFTLVGQVAAGASGVLTNQVRIASSAWEVVTNDNTAIFTLTLGSLPPADLSLVKSGPLSITVGARLTYTLAFSNSGEQEALGVVITDALPDGVSFTQQSALYPFTRSGAVLTWQVGALPVASGTLSLTVSGLVSPSAAGELVNRAGITTPSPEAHLADNRAVFTTTLLRPADPLDVVINELAWGGTAASPADEWVELYNNTPYRLDLIGWRLRAYTGTLDIALTGLIPAHGYFLLERSDDQAVSDIAADWIGSFGGGLANAGDRLTLSDATGRAIDTANADGGPWPAGTASPAYTSMERLDAQSAGADGNWLSNDGLLRNGLDANGGPLNATPKSSNAATVPDLALVKLGPATALPGALITYTLGFSQAGRLSVPDVCLTDTLPPGLSYVRQSSSYPFTRILDGRGLVWQIGLLSPGRPVTLALVASLPTSFTGWLTNTAAIRSPLPDRRPANNQAAWASLVAAPSPDLHLVKTAAVSLTAGAELTYTFSLSNVGQQAAVGVRVSDSLPAGLTYRRQTAAFPFRREGQQLVWEIADVPPGAAALGWVLGVEVDVDLAGWLTNTAQAGARSPEAFLDNNTAQASTFVAPPPAVLRLNGVLPDGYQLDDDDEAIQIINLGPAAVNLAGWRLTKGSSSGVRLESGQLPAGRLAWAARSALAFRASFGFWPQFAADLTGVSPVTVVLPLQGVWPRLAGGDVQLYDPAGELADRLVYQADLVVDGWHGPGLDPYPLGAIEGQILARRPDEQTGRPVSDTDTAADWLQSTASFTAGRRVLYPGWQIDPFFWPLSLTVSPGAPLTVTLGVAPDNAYDLVRDAIRQARRRIAIEAYTLEQYDLVNDLAERARAGVSVTALLEGEPAGGLALQALWACQTLQAAGGACAFMHSYHPTGYRIFDRYDLVHAKFIVVDGQSLLVSTQNFSAGGLPADDKSDGSYGSRGYVLRLDSPALAARAGLILAGDADPAQADIAAWPNPVFGFGPPPAAFSPLTASGGFTSPVFFPAPLAFNDVSQVELFSAPEAALRQSDALLGLLARATAGDAVYAEQLYEHVAWRDAPNPRLEAYIQAARRGASVRLLLNRGKFDQPGFDLTHNVSTTAYVNALAQAEGLDLQARMGDPTHYGIHSKLVLVRLAAGHYAHVGSINGSEASSKLNRELAVQVESAGLYDALARVFWSDWHLSGPLYLPLLLKNCPPPPPPPPVEHLVISEVYYSNTVSLQWIELYNPTSQTMDLAGYKMGDAETPQRFEGMYAFPPGAHILPGGVVVVAYDAAQVQVPVVDFQLCPTCGGEAPVLSKYAGWGEGDWTLAGHGDQVLLLGPDDAPVDVLVYGDAGFPAVVAHPGVSLFTHSLERRPAMYDTDDCARDFIDVYPPGPGLVDNVRP